jgi:intracellular multiplication protein IcmL
MSEGALEVVMNRNFFYRDNYRRVVAFALLLIFSNIAAVAVIFWQVAHPAQPAYFATDNSGKITPLYSLSQPIISQSSLLEWATRASVTAYSYNFVEYEAQLQRAGNFFTPRGWANFTSALKSSRNLETVIVKKLVATAVPTGAPVILNRGVLGGRYSWKVKIPILVNYQSASTQFQQSLTVIMIIKRVPNVNDPKGIAIDQFIASVVSSGG